MNNLSFNDFGLDMDILKSIKILGYKNPSEVQEKVIPLILKKNDIIVKSQTGSGKTAAFSIPICSQIHIDENLPQVLVISPTRELAIQIKEDFSNIGKFKRINCMAVFGKEPITVQTRKLNQRVHVVVGTPGRILDHIKRKTFNVKNIRYLVIDEADEMLNMGFIDQVRSIINKLPKNRSTLLFSATISSEILKLCSSYMTNPTSIDIKSRDSVLERIKQTYYEVEAAKKFDLLAKLIYIEKPDSAMIFCRTKKNVEDLLCKMKDKGFPCSALHGGFLQSERIDAIRQFREGKFIFLICTDVAARGIDVEDVTHVINYDIPMEKESYIHRIGRTGRAGNTGTAITFVTRKELRFLEQTAETFNLNIEKGRIPTKEKAASGKKLFNEKLESAPKLKKDRSKHIDKDVTKVYISAGKKKKIGPGDIAGTISSIAGVNPEDVGVIDINDTFSYVDILSGKGNMVINGLEGKTIKGRKIRAEKAQK
ncbi:MAG: DEAD/DEAH box helicase [Clostridium sp.]|jgi:superfamily II DNA/RNA helicase|uniref:DEAD/DEAH box helicase n=1 Tax=Clostridium sp. TaxID=1506 RepID=UPI0025BEAD45|nr:DEAD/DEAH box helicase [Clostridium sp.]MCH3964424.1 DEAD/DEAH box helicase [Clostridium sp.]MCI1715599.1 DEAD/DEAH box helicase [Clostridium sp.]MCI1799609.1 DEAD/DEAH box helicase [Clostridium sp.]MCI1813783.1 DEAD/DEAH box helicase [Clostridium sp.]MCI1870422.1 DEAD/DEAH box helicase [Clostridium sp.]